MSDILLNEQMEGLKVGRKISSYTGVIIHAGKSSDGKDIVYSVGNSNGYVLEFDHPFGTREMANRILAGLSFRNVSYQPFESAKTIIDPAVEIGDGVSVNGKDAIIWDIKASHNDLMASDVSAPYDEELNHEFRYVPRETRKYSRESAYTRANLTLTKDSISAEVSRAKGAEAAIQASVSIQADRITSEISRSRNQESKIDQRIDSLTFSVTGTNGTSVFTITDGRTTLTSQEFDLSVKAVNVKGTLTADQIATGAITIGKLDADAKSKLVVSSQTRAQYYLSTSSESATGGSWSSTMPTWSNGKYIWTREKTTDTFADNTTNDKYSPSENGRYDKNLTNALSTATAAGTAAAGAQTSASGALARSRIIYYSSSGGTLPTVPTEWINDSTGDQNKWTLVRPEYSKNYPTLYTATQRETVGGTFSCTTPRLDATTTVIDGAHIITGTIDATKIAVSDLSALNATIGGWSIGSEYLKREVENSCRVYLRAQPASSISTNSYAIQVQKYDTENAQFKNYFTVTYGGKVTCTDIKITGGEMSGGKVGGATVGSSSFGGVSIPSSGINAGMLVIPTANIDDGAVTTAKINNGAVTTNKIVDAAISGVKLQDDSVTTKKLLDKCVETDKINDSAVTTLKVSTGVENSLTLADHFGETCKGSGFTYTPPVLRANGLLAYNWIEAAGSLQVDNSTFTLGGSTVSKATITIDNTSYQVLVWS